MSASSRSTQTTPLEEIKAVIEVVPCTSGLDNGVLELNAANAAQFVVKEETLDLWFEGQYADLARDGSFCMQHELRELIISNEIEKLKGLYPGQDFGLRGNILEVTFVGSSQDDVFDFKFGTPLTRMSMVMTKFLVEKLSANYERYLTDTTQRLAAVAIPKMEPGTFIASKCKKDEVMSNYFTLAQPVPVIQTDSSLYLSTVRMYGGLQNRWLVNTIAQLKAQKDKRVIRRDSLLGFVVANLPASKLVYDTAKYGPEFPENTDTFLIVPSRVVNQVIENVTRHAQIVDKNSSVCIAHVPFFLESTEMQHDFHFNPSTQQFVSKSNVVHVIDGTKRFKIVVRVKLRIQYVKSTETTTAMDVNDGHLWYRDVWRISDVNRETCKVKEDAKPFECTIAAQVRQRKKKIVDEQRKKTAAPKRTRVGDAEREIHNDDDSEHLNDQSRNDDGDDAFDSFTQPSSSSSYASSSTQLADD